MKPVLKLIITMLVMFVIFAFPACAKTYVPGNHISYLDLDDDNISLPFEIGFLFPFYGSDQTQFYVTTNGAVSFGGVTDVWENTQLPASTYNYPAVFPFWDDLHPKGSTNVAGSILYKTIAAGEYGNPYGKDVLVVQWTNYGFYASELVMGTFQVHLVSDGNITFNYNDLIAPERAYGQSATIGIQQDGSSNFVQHSLEEDAGIRSGYTVRLAYNGENSYTNLGASTDGFWDMLLYKDGSIQPPDKPENPNPAIGSTASTSPNLSWNAAINADNYRVLVSMDSNMNDPVYSQIITGTSANVSVLSAGTEYYWQVIARNAGGETPSDLWNFTTSSNIRILTYTAGTHGEISGMTSQTVVAGQSGTLVTAVPDTGYHFVQWSDDSTDNPRTDTDVNTNISVDASFAINTYKLTYTADSNGSLTGDPTQSVTYGSDSTAVTAVPNAGYYFVQWSDDSTANPRTDTSVTANITAEAEFAINQSPATPGAFTSPSAGQKLKGSYPLTISWGVSTDPEDDVVKYDLFFFNGTWTKIGNQLNSNSMVFTLSEDNTGSAKFRVYANDTQSNSSAREVTFTIDSLGPAIAFGTNGNSTDSISHSTTVTGTDVLAGISQMSYAWTQNQSLSSVLSWTLFDNGDTLIKDSVDGNWYLHINATDNVGNTNYSVSDVFKLDNSLPIIYFGTDGNNAYAQSHNTSVMVVDSISGIQELAYAWTQDNDINSVSEWMTFESGDILAKDSVNGDWYLHIRAIDNASNTNYSVSDVFRFDNTPPSFSWLQKPLSANTGDTVVVELNATDISSLSFYSIKVDGEEYQMNTSSGNYSWIVYIPASDSGTLVSQVIYNCTFSDLAGNIGSTGNILLNVSILPVADFATNATRGIAPLEVDFEDASSGLVDEWHWNFGDGEVSTEQNPVHTFGSGNFTVDLTVTNINGSSSHLLNIKAAEPLNYTLKPEDANQISIYGEEMNFSLVTNVLSSFKWYIDGKSINGTGVSVSSNTDDSSRVSFCSINTSQYIDQSDFFVDTYNISVVVSNESTGIANTLSWDWTVTNSSTVDKEDICFIISNTANVTPSGNISCVEFNTTDDDRTDNVDIPSSITFVSFNTSSNASALLIKVEVLDKSSLNESEAGFLIDSVYQYFDISFSNETLVDNTSDRSIEFRILDELNGGSLAITSVRLKHWGSPTWKIYVPELLYNDGTYSYFIVRNISGFSPFAVTADYEYSSRIGSGSTTGVAVIMPLLPKQDIGKADESGYISSEVSSNENYDDASNQPGDRIGEDGKGIVDYEGENDRSNNIMTIAGVIMLAAILILLFVSRKNKEKDQ